MGKTIRRSANHYSSANEFFKNEKLIRHKKVKRDLGWSNHPDFRRDFNSNELCSGGRLVTRFNLSSIELGNINE